MRIFITGATGLIGTCLVNALQGDNDIQVLTRSPSKARELFGTKVTATTSLPSFNHIDVIINLAGEPIAAKRWTTAQKERICQSRWQLTRDIVNKIKRCDSPPRLLLSGSAVGYYGRQPDDQHLTEQTYTAHPEFQHDLCATWEQIATEAASDRTRVCLLRTGIVLSPDAGALPRMALPFRFGFGGPLGNGKQMISWIHLDDMVNAILYLLYNENCSGPYNMTAPTPVSNAEFSQALASQLQRPNFLRMPAPILRGLLGEMADLLLTGQSVLPQRLLESGFHYRHPTLKQALQNCYPKP